MKRSYKVTTEYSNSWKKTLIDQFRKDYTFVVQSIIDDIWLNTYTNPITKKRSKSTTFNFERLQLELDSDLDNDFLKQFNHFGFSQRMMQACGTQASSIIRSCTTKNKKRKYVVSKLMKEKTNCSKLQSILDTSKVSKPKLETLNPQLDQRFYDIKYTNNSSKFDGFIKIKLYQHIDINIPFNKYKKYKELESKGKLLNSIRLDSNNISLTFELPDVVKKTEGLKVGADQGIKTCLTLSDQQITKKNKDGYDLDKIIHVLNRRQKGSKGYKRTQDHRNNYINWSLNQLDYSNIKELNLEKLHEVRKGKKSSKYLSAFTYPLIKKKLISISETEGFVVNDIDNMFRSQRCSNCSWTQQSSRHGKLFKCKCCGFATDADLNASYNLKDDSLYAIPVKVRLDKINLKGFFWNSNGLFDLNKEPIVPYVKNNITF